MIRTLYSDHYGDFDARYLDLFILVEAAYMDYPHKTPISLKITKINSEA